MAALLDAAVEAHPRARRRPCGLTPILAGPLGDDLRTMLAAPDRWSHVEVARALRRVLGPDFPGISKDVIGRHRREDCPCRS